MLTFTVTKGVLNSPQVIAIIGPAELGGVSVAAGQFDDAPALTCTLWPGDDRASVGTLAATWHDAPAALVRIDFTQATIDALETGWVKSIVTLASTGLVIAEFEIKIEAGPGSRAARPVYCSYQDLEDELSWIEDLRSETKDQSGFAEARADARDWIDSVILAAVPGESGDGLRSYSWGWTWGGECNLGRRYSDLLTSNGLDVTSVSGRRIVKAAVYQSLSTILERCVGSSAGGGHDLVQMSNDYRIKADALIICCTADFAGSTLRPLNLGVARGRC